MQKMVDYLYENKYFDVVPVAKELLEEEQQQIMMAYLDGESNVLDRTGSYDWLKSKRTDSAEYYNQAYN